MTFAAIGYPAPLAAAVAVSAAGPVTPPLLTSIIGRTAAIV